MHAAENAVTTRTAQALIAGQVPELAGLGLRRVGREGTDTVLYRVGPGHIARFPRLSAAEAQIDRVARWLPALAAHLPLEVPRIDLIGAPGLGYPFRWTVGPWVAGRDAFAAPPPDQMEAGASVADFLIALHSLPRPEGAPLRDDADRLDRILAGLDPFIAGFEGEADQGVLRRLVAEAREVPGFRAAPVWVHGDLHPLNLVTRRGRLSGVIDWGTMGPGDPGVDMMVGWTLLDPPARRVLRDRLRPDPAVWARGRALALAKAIMAIPYYRRSNPVFHAAMKRTLDRVLQEADS
jgi:aminoglycoside phosphotransferase (APT) family kinase protein